MHTTCDYEKMCDKVCVSYYELLQLIMVYGYVSFLFLILSSYY